VPEVAGKLFLGRAGVFHAAAAMVRTQLDEQQWATVAAVIEAQRVAPCPFIDTSRLEVARDFGR
jgi:hypothetical protein